MSVTHHFHNTADRRSLYVLGIKPLDDGTFVAGPHPLTLDQVVALIGLLTAGVRIADILQARAFVLGLSAQEAELLALACAERARPGATDQGVG